MTRSRYRIGEGHYPYFLTCTVVGWLPVFTRPETVQIVYVSNKGDATILAAPSGLGEDVRAKTGGCATQEILP